MSVIAISNQKGGVGKTTTTVNLGVALADRGHRVLVIDLDPQGNLSTCLSVRDIDQITGTVGDLLIEGSRNAAARATGILQAIRPTEVGVDLLPANQRLASAEVVLGSALGRELILREVLRPVRDRYDYVLIDCLPTLGLLAINGLAASDAVLVPLQAEYLAMQGLAQLLESVIAVRDKLNPNLQMLGILLTMVDLRTLHCREVVDGVRKAFAGRVRVFDTMIRTSVALKESTKDGRSVLRYDPSGKATQAYRQLAVEVESISLPTAAPAAVPAMEAPSAVGPAPKLDHEIAEDRDAEPVGGDGSDDDPEALVAAAVSSNGYARGQTGVNGHTNGHVAVNGYANGHAETNGRPSAPLTADTVEELVGDASELFQQLRSLRNQPTPPPRSNGFFGRIGAAFRLGRR